MQNYNQEDTCVNKILEILAIINITVAEKAKKSDWSTGQEKILIRYPFSDNLSSFTTYNKMFKS